jgi:hypothetical protein
MQMNSLDKYTTSFGLSLAITCLISALLVVVKELSPNVVLAWMKQATIHHWITHGIIDMVVFVGLGLALVKVPISLGNVRRMIVGSVVVSGLIIAGFYLLVG